MCLKHRKFPTCWSVGAAVVDWWSLLLIISEESHVETLEDHDMDSIQVWFEKDNRITFRYAMSIDMRKVLNERRL